VGHAPRVGIVARQAEGVAFVGVVRAEHLHTGHDRPPRGRGDVAVADRHPIPRRVEAGRHGYRVEVDVLAIAVHVAAADTRRRGQPGDTAIADDDVPVWHTGRRVVAAHREAVPSRFEVNATNT